MALIEWNPRYATGISEIDTQHQSLVEAIRRLQHSLETGQAHAETMELMAFLLKYVNEHFALEEAYMEHIRYRDLPQHRQLHDQLRLRVHALSDRLNQNEHGLALELSMLLFEWLRDHILHDDFMYVAHARERKGQKG